MNMLFSSVALAVTAPVTGDNSVVGIAIVVMAVVAAVAAVLLITSRKH